MSVKQLSNGKIMDGVYTRTLALNTESVATFITTCYLKKASKSSGVRREPDRHEHSLGSKRGRALRNRKKGAGEPLTIVVAATPRSGRTFPFFTRA